MASLPRKSLRDRVRAVFWSKRRAKLMCSSCHHFPQENVQEPENDVCLVPGPSTDRNVPSASKPSMVTAATKCDNLVAGQAASNPQKSMSLESFSMFSTQTLTSSLERLYKKYKAENEKRLQNPKPAADVDTARPALRYKISRDSTIVSLPSLGSEEEELVDFARPLVAEEDARQGKVLDINARLKDNVTQEELVTLPISGQCWLMESTNKSVDKAVLTASKETLIPEENKTKEAAGEHHANINDSKIIFEGQKFRLRISDKILFIDGSFEEILVQGQLSFKDLGAPGTSSSGGLGVSVLCGDSNVRQGTGINISGENVYVNVWDTAAGMKPPGAEGACDLSKKVNECSTSEGEQIQTDSNKNEEAKFHNCNIHSDLRRVADIRPDLQKFKDIEPYLQKGKDIQSGLQKFEDIQPNLHKGKDIPEELNISDGIRADLNNVENGSCDIVSRGSCAVAENARGQALTMAESNMSPELATGSESFCTAEESVSPALNIRAMKSTKQPLNRITGTVNDVCECQIVSAVAFFRSQAPVCNLERQNFPEDAGPSCYYKAGARNDSQEKIMTDENCEVRVDSWSFDTPQVKYISGSGSSDLVGGIEPCNVGQGHDSSGQVASEEDSVIDSRLHSGSSRSELRSTDECQDKEPSQDLIRPEVEGQTEASEPTPREGGQLGEEQGLVESSHPEASGLGSSGEISDTLMLSAKLNDTRESYSVSDDCGLIDVYTFTQKIQHETNKLNKLFNKYKSRKLRIERLHTYLDQLKSEKEEMTRLLQGVDQETAALRQEAADLRCTVAAVCDTSVASIGKETEAKRLEPACYRRYTNIRTPADAANALSSVRNRIRALNDLEVLIYRKQLLLLHVLPSTHQDKTPPTKVVLPTHKVSKSKKPDPGTGSLASGSSIVIEIVSEANNRTEEVTRTDSAVTISTPLSMSNDDTASGSNKRVSRV